MNPGSLQSVTHDIYCKQQNKAIYQSCKDREKCDTQSREKSTVERDPQTNSMKLEGKYFNIIIIHMLMDLQESMGIASGEKGNGQE